MKGTKSNVEFLMQIQKTTITESEAISTTNGG